MADRGGREGGGAEKVGNDYGNSLYNSAALLLRKIMEALTAKHVCKLEHFYWSTYWSGMRTVTSFAIALLLILLLDSLLSARGQLGILMLTTSTLFAC